MTEKPRDEKPKPRDGRPGGRAEPNARTAPGDLAGTKGVVIDLAEYRKRKGKK